MISPGIPYDEMMRLSAEELADTYEREGFMDREYGLAVHHMLHSGKEFD